MSRIDISVEDHKTGELVANRGFCRDIHLTDFCKSSSDKRVSDFAYEIFIGVELTQDNAENFIDSLKYTISYLQSIEKENRKQEFSYYDEESYNNFLSDLQESLNYLVSFCNKENLQQFQIEII